MGAPHPPSSVPRLLKFSGRDARSSAVSLLFSNSDSTVSGRGWMLLALLGVFSEQSVRPFDDRHLMPVIELVPRRLVPID